MKNKMFSEILKSASKSIIKTKKLMNLIKPLRIDVWKKFTQFSSQIHNTKESFSHLIGRTEPKKFFFVELFWKAQTLWETTNASISSQYSSQLDIVFLIISSLTHSRFLRIEMVIWTYINPTLRGLWKGHQYIKT